MSDLYRHLLVGWLIASFVLVCIVVIGGISGNFDQLANIFFYTTPVFGAVWIAAFFVMRRRQKSN